MSVTDEVKARLDLVNYVGNYVPLKKAGQNHKGVCPFHNDKTPSFVVFPDSQTWHCFGACGEGGDIFKFAEKYEGWDFKQALTALAAQAGVELTPLNPRQMAAQEATERIQAALASAADFFQDALYNAPQADHARAYVESRGLTWETAQDFGLGYAHDDWNTLEQSLLAQGYDLQDLLDAGLVVKKDNGTTYDRFRDRLMIPIRDAGGYIIGFGARALKPEAQPKYLNSPQTLLFDKSHVLFGLSLARRAIREEQTAIIVEGYMDVMQARQAGFANVVAQMGTALTEHQLRMLRRYASRMILALDADNAGKQATMRGLDAARAALDQQAQASFDARGMITYESFLDAEIRVLLLPDGTDPDDLIRQSPENWQQLVTESMPVAEYAIAMATQGRNLDDPKVKKAIVHEVIPIIDDIADAVERDHYRQRVARLLKVREQVLMVGSAAASLSATVRSRRSSPPEPTPTEQDVGGWQAQAFEAASPHEAYCIATLVHLPNTLYKADRIFKQIAIWPEQGEWNTVSSQDFVNPEHRGIFTVWREALAQIDHEPFDYLRQSLDDTLAVRLMALLEEYPVDLAGPDPKRVTMNTLRGLLEQRLRRLKSDMEKFKFLLEEEHAGGDLTARPYQVTIANYIVARPSLERAIAELASGNEPNANLEMTRTL